LEKVQGLFENFPYLGPFIFLLLCGLGLPSPEEVALIGAGILLHNRDETGVHYLPMLLVCSSAILIGDSLPFWLGRHYGLAALKLKWVAKLLHPERFAALERRFQSHGNWAIFSCRFLPGLRIPGYFVAGTLRMSFWRFLILDTLGVAISVPASIYSGSCSGRRSRSSRSACTSCTTGCSSASSRCSWWFSVGPGSRRRSGQRWARRSRPNEPGRDGRGRGYGTRLDHDVWQPDPS
jgi:membrane protein DedA with SNARE-associated domain